MAKLNDATNSARSRKLKESDLQIKATRNLSFGLNTEDRTDLGDSLIGGYKIDNSQSGAISLGASEPGEYGYYSFDIDRSSFFSVSTSLRPVLTDWRSLIPNGSSISNPFVDVLLIGVVPNSGTYDQQYAFVISGINNIDSTVLSRSDSFGATSIGVTYSSSKLEISASNWVENSSPFSNTFEGVVNAKVSIADPNTSYSAPTIIKKQTIENDSDSSGFPFKVVGNSPKLDGASTGGATAISVFGYVDNFSGILHGLGLNCDFHPHSLSHSYIGGERQTYIDEFNSYNMSHLINGDEIESYSHIDPSSITKTSGQYFTGLSFSNNYPVELSWVHNSSYSDFVFSMNNVNKNSVAIPIYPSNTYYFDFLVDGTGVSPGSVTFGFGKKIRFGVGNFPNSDPSSATQSLYEVEIKNSLYTGQNPVSFNIGLQKISGQKDAITITATLNLEVCESYRAVFKGTVVSTPAIWDYDAHRFIINAVITDTHQRQAIHNLVVDLKSKFLWDKVVHFYPFVGGSATTHAFNLKSPGTNSLTFSGGWVHNSAGALGNGSNTYALTGVSSFSLGGFISMGVYLNNTKPASPTYAAEMGEYVGGNFLLIDTNGSQKRYFNIAGASIVQGSVDGKGFWAQSRSSATNFRGIFSDGTFGSNITNVGSTYPSAANGISIGARNTTGTPDNPSAQRFASAFIATSLTDEELIRMKTIVEKYNRWLYRL
jgi:hypothetical protein